jgi:hypothetical protein
MVSVERDGYLDDPTYIAGLPEDHPVKRNENVFAFSLSVASMEVLQLLAMVILPPYLANQGAQSYRFVTGSWETAYESCAANCLYPGFVAKGDSSGIVITGRHPIAQHTRALRI